MKSRLIVILALLCVVSCRRESTVTTGTEPTSTTTTLTGPPQDLANATVNTIISTDRGAYVENSRLGAALGKDGLVETEKNEFSSGDSIYLSMWFRESPAGLQSRVAIEDEEGEEIASAQKAMEGKKTVTFPISAKSLKPGKYRAVGYWGGNVAAEHEFTIKGK